MSDKKYTEEDILEFAKIISSAYNIPLKYILNRVPNNKPFKMNENVLQLAEEAGFCFWGDESWRPNGAIIDWSTDYDQTLADYTKLIIKKCLELMDDTSYLDVAEGNIKEYFGIE
jgi:hypothetical protein